MFCNTDACNQKRISWSKPVITSVELNQDNREKLRSSIDTFIVDEFEPVNTASSDRSNDQFNFPRDTNERNRMSDNVNTRRKVPETKKSQKSQSNKRPRLKEFIQRESDEYYYYYDEDSSEEYDKGEGEPVLNQNPKRQRQSQSGRLQKNNVKSVNCNNTVNFDMTTWILILSFILDAVEDLNIIDLNAVEEGRTLIAQPTEPPPLLSKSNTGQLMTRYGPKKL